MYRAIKRGYALVAIGTHLSQAAFNYHCFNTTWPPEDHIEGPEVLAAHWTDLAKKHFLMTPGSVQRCHSPQEVRTQEFCHA